MTYRFCNYLGHWKADVVCDNNLSKGTCKKIPAGCKLAFVQEITDEERERRRVRMAEVRAARKGKEDQSNDKEEMAETVDG